MVNLSFGVAAVPLSWAVLRPAVAAQTTRPTTKPIPLVDHGNATIDLVNKYLRGEGTGYCQEVTPRDPNFRPQGAFNWAMGIQFSALNAGARLDPARYQRAVAEC